MSLADAIAVTLLGVGLFFVGLTIGVAGDARFVDTKTVTETGQVATVELAPYGMAYCPADAAVPHPTPCENRP